MHAACADRLDADEHERPQQQVREQRGGEQHAEVPARFHGFHREARAEVTDEHRELRLACGARQPAGFALVSTLTMKQASPTIITTEAMPSTGPAAFVPVRNSASTTMNGGSTRL